MEKTTPNPDSRQPLDPLRLLAIIHYILGLLTVFLAVRGVPLVYVGWELKTVKNPSGYDVPGWLEWIATWLKAPELTREPVLLGTLLFATGLTIILLSIIHGLTIAYIGRCIVERRRRTLTLVFSWFDLTYCGPGTLLSVFVIVMLRRPEVVQQFKDIDKARR